ncbi:unnamed protein product [Cylicocyclus nassatus]|uniref:Uncharacterized protein n=1 Tax=Cylicocyclus nassatus TaxID=53992 RepID=A0AA36HA82_CYLNA|nr:unnamed protein product [Cylicocyclus nassatus]
MRTKLTMVMISKLHIFVGLFAICFFIFLVNSYTVYTHTRSVANETLAETKAIQNIAILSIINGGSDKAKYKTAMLSVQCYALQNNYTYLQLNGEDFKTICEQRHVLLQRHCIVAHILKTYNFSWVLHVEADIGVVNEKMRIEEYIKEDVDLIFYERFFNFEIAAGSYFAKKSDFSVMFLRGWADYEFRLPKTFHNDNLLLQMWFVELLAPNAPLTQTCWILWRNALWKNAVKLKSLWKIWSLHTLCCREALKSALTPHLFLYTKGNGWVRDSWLTNSHWSQKDFMFHDRKEKRKKHFNGTQELVLDGPKFDWFDTLKKPLILDRCTKDEPWDHESALITSEQVIESHLEKRKKSVEHEYRVHLRQLQEIATSLNQSIQTLI